MATMVRYVVHGIPASLRYKAGAAHANDYIDEGIFVHIIHKGSAADSLGVELHSVGESETTGVIVGSLDAGSPLSGSLRVGDVILSIDWRLALGATQSSEMLRSAAGQVLLLVLRSHSSPVRHMRVRTPKGGQKYGIVMEREIQKGASSPVVMSLTGSSPLREAGVRVGETVVAIGGVPVLSTDNGVRLLQDAAARADEVRIRGPPEWLFPSPFQTLRADCPHLFSFVCARARVCMGCRWW